MTTNLIRKIPKAIMAIKHISNISKLHQRGFSKLHKTSNDFRCASPVNIKPYFQQNGSFQNLARISSLPMMDVNQRVDNIGAMSLGMRNRFPPSFSLGETKFPSKMLCSCCPPLMDPRGRVAVVTGATRGIGLSIVEELLCNGAKVFMIDLEKEIGECTATRLASIYGWENIQFAAGDVTCYESFEACVHLATCKFQRLDILVNNAGVLTACQRDKIIDINYKSLIFGTRLGFKYMGADQGKDGGVVINMGSVVGLIGLPGAPVYSATKHAVIGATMSYGDCLTYDKTCVRVCAVCPGVTTTAMTTSIDDLPVEHFRDGTDERTLLKDSLNSMPPQPAMRLGPATAHVIRYGQNGSIWVTEDSEVYQVMIPDYHDIECCNSRIKDLDC